MGLKENETEYMLSLSPPLLSLSLTPLSQSLSPLLPREREVKERDRKERVQKYLLHGSHHIRELQKNVFFPFLVKAKDFGYGKSTTMGSSSWST